MKNNVKPEIGNFIMIPECVAYDARLSDKEKIMFGMILSLTRSLGHCKSRNEYFTKKLSCSTSTVTNCISRLSDLGYVIVLQPKGHRRRIKINYATLRARLDLIENSKVDSNFLEGTSEKNGDFLPEKPQHKIESNKELENISKREWHGEAKRLPFSFSSNKEMELRTLLTNDLFPLRERVADFFDFLHQDCSYSVNSIMNEMIESIPISRETCETLNKSEFEEFLLDLFQNVFDNLNDRLKKKEDDIAYHSTGDAFTLQIKRLGEVLEELMEFDLNADLKFIRAGNHKIRVLNRPKIS